MKKLRIELVVAVFIFISCISSGAAFANQSSVSLEAPNSVERGTEITIKVHVTHSANNYFHYTKWVSIKVNGEEIARWDYGKYKYKRPKAKNFTSEIKYIVYDYALWTGKCENLSKYKHTRSLSFDGQVFVNLMTYIYIKNQ